MLMWAAYQGHLGMMEMLLKAGANVNDKSNDVLRSTCCECDELYV